MDNNLVGQTIQGRYYVVKQLGRGGVGVTFVAQDQQCFDSPCVVKQLKPKVANTKTLEIARRLFNREAEIMNRLGDCDRIPRLLAYFEHNNDFFLVQELIEGHDLSQEIIIGEPWSAEKTIALLRDTLEVLLFVQQNSVIHRDLKPSNLMRRYKDNKIILIDFGSVKQVSTQIVDAAGQIKPTVAVGTKSYMPMEQMVGRPGFYSDIYAVGIIAIQALTGVHPQQLKINDDGEIVWRNRLNSKLNYQPLLLDILDKMIRRRYQERYTSAGVVLSDLDRLDADKNNDRETVLVANHQPTNSKSPENNATKIITPPNSYPARKNERNKPEKSNQIKKSQQTNKQTKLSKAQSKIWAIAAAMFAVLAAALGAWFLLRQNSSQPQNELSPYENKTLGFKVDYPQTWQQQERNDIFVTGVYFSAPLEGDGDNFRERVSVSVEDLAAETSLAQYTNDALAQIKHLSDPNTQAARTANLGQAEARQVIYTGTENDNSVRKMQTWLVKDKQAYVITYTAQTNSYEDYLPMVEAMLASFEIVTP